MKPSKTIAGLLTGTAMVVGGIDASTLKEVPLERVEMIAHERVEARQIGNVVETTLPWKGENGIKVKVDLGEPTLAEKVKDKRKKEVITETVTDFDGGFKVDILLNEKPTTNRFCYTIEGAEDYDFFYQPPLTEQEKAEGAYRPPEIEGSYAVYHKTLRDHVIGKENYATGKVMHIPRPQVWELGNEEATKRWADLSYTEGQLCVTVPQDFLDNADYTNGVRIDPTFGYTSVGASTCTVNIFNSADGKYVTLDELPETSQITKITGSVKVFSASFPLSFRGILYSENPASTPDSLEGSTISEVISSGTFELVDFSMFEPVPLVSANYFIGLHAEYSGTSGANASVSCENVSSRVNYNNSDTFSDGASDPYGSTSSIAFEPTIYATYEQFPHGIHINNGTIKINNGTLDL